MSHEKRRIPKHTLIWRLLLVWLAGGGLILLVMIAQLMGGAIEDPKSAFGWFGTVVLPAPTLLLGAFMAPAAGSEDVDQQAGWLALGFSIAHLALVAGTFLWFAFQSARPMSEIMEASNYFLAITQGFVTFMLGRLAGSGPKTS